MTAHLRIRVQPRSARTEVAGERDGRLIVRVTTPPAEGRANDAVCALLARRLRVGKTRVEILRGHGSRDKVVRVEGLTDAEAREALGMPASPKDA